MQIFWKIARDASQNLLQKEHLLLCKLKDFILPKDVVVNHKAGIDKFIVLLEAYCDNFIAVRQAKSLEELQHATRYPLYSIESIFQEGILI